MSTIAGKGNTAYLGAKLQWHFYPSSQSSLGRVSFGASEPLLKALREAGIEIVFHVP